MPSQSSSRLNLIQLKLQAKELRKAHTAGESEALERIKAHLPLLAAASEQKLNKYPLSLTEAKHVIAGEKGLAGWPKLKRYVELGQFELQVEALQKAHSAGDPDACRLIKANFPVLAGYSESNICAYPLSLEEAQLVIARDNALPEGLKSSIIYSSRVQKIWIHPCAQQSARDISRSLSFSSKKELIRAKSGSSLKIVGLRACSSFSVSTERHVERKASAFRYDLGRSGKWKLFVRVVIQLSHYKPPRTGMDREVSCQYLVPRRFQWYWHNILY